MTDIEKLKGFASAVLDCWPEDCDGADIQNLAEKFGLLEKIQVTEPCGEQCDCAGMQNIPGECYRRTALAKGE